MTDDAIGTIGLLLIATGAVSVGANVPLTAGILFIGLGGVLWIAGNR